MPGRDVDAEGHAEAPRPGDRVVVAEGARRPVTTCATTPTPNRMRTIVPTNSATSSPMNVRLPSDATRRFLSSGGPRVRSGVRDVNGAGDDRRNGHRSASPNAACVRHRRRLGTVPRVREPRCSRWSARPRSCGCSPPRAGRRPLAHVSLDARRWPSPPPTACVRTLREVGFVDQDPATGHYASAPACSQLGAAPRSTSTTCARWRSTGPTRSPRAPAWRPCVVHADGGRVVVVHHVFRPDGCTPEARTGAALPLHATAFGKVLLAFAPRAVRRWPRTTSASCEEPHPPHRSPTRPALLPRARRRPRRTAGRRRSRSREPGMAAAGRPVRDRDGRASSPRSASRAGPTRCSAHGGRPRPPLAELRDAARRGRSRGLTGTGMAADEPQYVAAIDQGTTSTRCMLFDRAGPDGRASPSAQHRQCYPHPGCVEHDAERDLAHHPRARPAGARGRRARGGQRLIAARRRQPARDRRGLGPGHRPTARPRDRLAGHPHLRRPRARSPTPMEPAEITAPHGAAACRRTPRARGCAGCSTASRGCASARRPASCCSARWRAGWSGT